MTDPESSLTITGIIGETNEKNKTYIDTLYLMSPEGAHLTFNTSGVILHGEHTVIEYTIVTNTIQACQWKNISNTMSVHNELTMEILHLLKNGT